MLCEYGCGGEGIYTLKNETKCCSEFYQGCSAIKLKNSNGNKGKSKDARREGGNVSNSKKTECIYCYKIFSITGIKSHERHCHLNPQNIRHCPMCGKIIKNYRDNKTCSKSCGSKLGKNKECLGTDRAKSINYRLICFASHGKKCIICDEDLIVEVHHLDGVRTNNIPINLIPLCPTHHHYCHHEEYWYILKECIEEYIKKFGEGSLGTG